MPNELQGLLGGMQATPRNKLMGLLADGLKAADRYANKPDPTMPGGKANPPLSLLSDLASLKSLAEVANNVSYGYPLTNKGVANVPFLKPETADALMMAPISPRNALAAAALAGGGDTAAMKAIFAGIGAKTADKAALARAEKLAASGADPKAIWRDTGWFKGGDGKWRFEIDDSASRLRDYNYTPQEAYKEARTQAFIDGTPSDAVKAMAPYASKSKSQLVDEYKRTGGLIVDAAMAGDKDGAMRVAQDRGGLDAIFGAMRSRSYGPASSYMAHGELGAAYPDVYKLHTRIAGDLGDSTKGQYLRGSDTQGEQIALAGKPRYSDDKSTMLHELQHAVQQREGFAQGGNADQLAQEYGAARSRLHFLEQEPEFKAANQELDKLWDDVFTKGTVSEAEAVAREAELMKRFPTLAEQRTLMGRLKNSSEDGYTAYKNLAGEAEARAVQKRMNMNPQQRREVFPLDSYDVPINSLIYR